VGTNDRLDALKKNCPNAKLYEKNKVVVVPDLDAEGGGGDYLLKNELFATGFGIKYIDTKGNIANFFPTVATLVNENFFGSLSCSIMIHPTTKKSLGSIFEDFVYSVNWGTIGINIWAGMMAINPYGTWGAPDNRHSEVDIQSGKGKMGNALLFQNVNKSVIEGTWNDLILVSLFSPPDKNSSAKARAYANLALNQSMGALVKLVLAVTK